MGTLYFENSHGEKKLVNSNIAKDNVISAIYADVKERSNGRFKIYYVRSRERDEGKSLWYDVGSHTEFYLWEEN